MERKFCAYYRSGKTLLTWEDLQKDAELGEILMGNLDDVSPAMQFIGIFDNSGEEIYTDFLVRAKFQGNHQEDLFLVRYDSEKCQVLFQDISNCQSYPLQQLDRDSIVIAGNLHQNPELIPKALEV